MKTSLLPRDQPWYFIDLTPSLFSNIISLTDVALEYYSSQVEGCNIILGFYT